MISRESIEVALFKTFTVPTVSKILLSTREFEKAPLRRAEDTELILSEIIDVFPRIQNQLMKNQVVTTKEKIKQYERAELSIHRLNELHGKYPILNDDYIFTVALFVDEPIRWINTFEWRPLDIREINVRIHPIGSNDGCWFTKPKNLYTILFERHFLKCGMILVSR